VADPTNTGPFKKVEIPLTSITPELTYDPLTFTASVALDAFPVNGPTKDAAVTTPELALMFWSTVRFCTLVLFWKVATPVTVSSDALILPRFEVPIKVEIPETKRLLWLEDTRVVKFWIFAVDASIAPSRISA